MEKNTHFKAFCCIFLLGVMILFNLNFVISDELTTFDNVKTYDPIAQKVTIENTFGLGRTIADITLDTPTNYKVAMGYQKVAQFTINTYDDVYNNPLEKIDFYNRANYIIEQDKATTLEKQFDYKLLTYENVVVDDYKTVCDPVESKNETKLYDCYPVVSGNHTETKEKWIDFDYSKLNAGKYVIGIFTEVLYGDDVEYIPQFYGVKINEWASYTQEYILSVGGVDSSQTNAQTAKTGHKIIPLSNQSVVNITKMTDDGATMAYIQLNYTNNTIIGMASFDGLVATFNPPINITKNVTYYFIADANGSSYARHYKSSGWADNVTRNGSVWSTDVGAPAGAPEGINQQIVSYTYINYTLVPPTNPSVILNAPVNYYNTSSQEVIFNISAFDYNDAGIITNVTLYIDGVLNETNTSNTNGTYIFTKILSEAQHNWSILAYNNNSLSNQSATRIFTVDLSAAQVQIVQPTNTTYYQPNFETIDNYTMVVNYTAADPNLDKCWWSNNSGSTNTTITCNNNITQFLKRGNYEYIVWANDTFGFENSSRISFTIANKMFQNGRIFNGTLIYETEVDEIKINLTANSSLTNVWLDYNGTVLPTVQYGNIWNYSKLLMNDDIGNNTLNWITQYAGVNYTTNNSYQIVSNATWTECDTGVFKYPFLNISFKDEVNDSVIQARIPSSTFIYYLGNGTYNKTYIYSNTSDNYDYKFCLYPQNKTVYVDYILQFSGGIYPQRIYNPTLLSFTSSPTNKTLYLLSTANGQYVTFQVLNVAEEPLSGVFVNATRDILGTTTVVGEGTTGTDGGVTFWLNPDFQHTITFYLAGYDNYTTTIYPTQSLYTIQMGGGTATSTDYTRGVNIRVTPTNFSLDNNTIYNFSAIITSTYWDITKWGWNLKNGSGVYYYNTSAATNGGILQTNVNTTSNSSFIMQLWYLANGTYTNYTYTWNVFNTLGDDWSLKTFGKDLKTYLGSGMFGLTNFGLGLIIFFVILVGTGILSYKFGFTSPAAITAAIFSIVFLLDVGLGLMDNLNPIDAVSHTPTIFVGLILIIFIIKEVQSQ